MPRGGVFAHFIGLGVGILNSFLVWGWETRLSKNCPGVLPGGWSGMELTDT